MEAPLTHSQPSAETSPLPITRLSHCGSNAERNEHIKTLRSLGVAPGAIACQLEISRNVVAGVLHRAGLSVEAKGRGHGAEPAFKRLVLAHYQQSKSIRRTAPVFGITPKTVWLWWSESAA